MDSSLDWLQTIPIWIEYCIAWDCHFGKGYGNWTSLRNVERGIGLLIKSILMVSVWHCRQQVIVLVLVAQWNEHKLCRAAKIAYVPKWAQKNLFRNKGVHQVKWLHLHYFESLVIVCTMGFYDFAIIFSQFRILSYHEFCACNFLLWLWKSK